jgi:quinol monooxygenase YgiN
VRADWGQAGWRDSGPLKATSFRSSRQLFQTTNSKHSLLTQGCQEHSAISLLLEQEIAMKHPFSDTLVMIAELSIKPEKLDEFLDYTVTNLEISRGAEGNIIFDILIDETQPDKVLFYEVWESAAAQQAYMAWRVERGDLTILMSFLAGEPKFTALRSIAC